MTFQWLSRFLSRILAIPCKNGYRITTTPFKEKGNRAFQPGGCMSFTKRDDLDIWIKAPYKEEFEHPFSKMQLDRYMSSLQSLAPDIYKTLEYNYDDLSFHINFGRKAHNYLALQAFRVLWRDPRHIYMVNYLTTNGFDFLEAYIITNLLRGREFFSGAFPDVSGGLNTYGGKGSFASLRDYLSDNIPYFDEAIMNPIRESIDWSNPQVWYKSLPVKELKDLKDLSALRKWVEEN